MKNCLKCKNCDIQREYIYCLSDCDHEMDFEGDIKCPQFEEVSGEESNP